jgi:hypothetical protein
MGGQEKQKEITNAMKYEGYTHARNEFNYLAKKKSAFTAVKEETTQICSFQRPVQNCIDIGL